MPNINVLSAQPEHLQSTLDFERLMADLSLRFINLFPHEVNREIGTALHHVCVHFGIDLALLWQWTNPNPDGKLRPTHVSALEGVHPPGPLLEEQFPWYLSQMLAGRTVAVSKLEELPAEAAVDYETCRCSGVKSTLCIPLAVGGDPPIGVLGLNSMRVAQAWPEAQVRRLQLIAQIITNALARGRRESQLRDSERRLTAGAEIAGLVFYEVNFEEQTAIVSDRFRDLLGMPANQYEQGLQMLEFWKEHLHPDDTPLIMRLREELHSGQLAELSVEYRFMHPDLGERWLHHLGRVRRRDAAGRTVESFGVLRDITAAKRASEALRDLSRRLIQAQEEERALLARELHDDVSQRLAALAIDVGRAELATPNSAEMDAMRSIRMGLVRLSEDVHSLAYQLHPSVLEELGLIEALRAECERRNRKGQFDVRMNFEPNGLNIGKDAALCLFRIAQEALANVARHANTSEVSITLRVMDDGFLLAVRDNGVGFNATAPKKGRSLGLASMRERIRLARGTLDVESALGQGTSIIAWVPAGESP